MKRILIIKTFAMAVFLSLAAVSPPPLMFAQDVASDANSEELRRSITGYSSDYAMRLALERMLSNRIETLKIECGLTEEQVSKLTLAGKGDIAKCFRDVDAAVERSRQRDATESEDRDQWDEETQNIHDGIKRRVSTSIYDDRSMLAGVLRSTLTRDQIERIGAEKQLKADLRKRQRIESFVVQLEHSLSFNDDQRAQLIATLIENYPQQSEDSQDRSSQNSRYDPIIAVMQTPRSRWPQFLDPQQVQAIDALMVHWRKSIPYLKNISTKK